ncbi:MAG: DUF2141 domain-containing protein [Saprospiraceae bacterium]|nr:DUF2141 domain-containing protein [Saprospiraceae bacterium]
MLFLLFLCCSVFSADAEMKITLHNIREAKGSIYVAVYDREGSFLSNETAKMRAQKIAPVTQAGSLDLSLGVLPAGRYALSCFHDVNGNGKLDTDWVGIPTEPYGFSNNARPKFRAPRWSESVFEWSGAATAIPAIRLEKW